MLDANPEVETCLFEEFSNEEKPNDGKLEYKIHQYHLQLKIDLERRWWACLKASRA